MQLPGHHYDGDDPDGYLARDEIVAHLERYATGFGAPIRTGVSVDSLDLAPGGGFDLATSDGPVRARAVVLATGAYQQAHRPAGSATLPSDLPQIDVEQYRNPGELPAGSVLVVGSGQSGCQIAEELLESGREVFLACGRAPWVPRRIGDHDGVWWNVVTGFFEDTVDALPSPEARLFGNAQATGRGGGHDLHYRTLRQAGVTLLGRFQGVEGRRVRFADDLAASVAWGDERYRMYGDLIRKAVKEQGLPMPDYPEPAPFDGRSPGSIELSGLGAVVFAGGFRPGYGAWVNVPGAFDRLGFPIHSEGACSMAPGLYFVGVHFLRKRKSSLFYGVGEDAALVADQIASTRRAPAV
jgi:putative flavoprotein involved in K+ transport